MPQRSRKSQAKQVRWQKVRDGQFDLCPAALDSGAANMASQTRDPLREITVMASHSQNDKRYSDYSRGTQCAANSLIFLAHHNEKYHIESADLDYVLQEGDALYTRIRRKLEAEGRFQDQYLAFHELPDTVELGGHRYTVVKSEPQCGMLRANPPGDMAQFVNLPNRLQSLGIEYNSAMLIVMGLCIGIFKDKDQRYGFFDPHARNEAGLRTTDKGGTAVMLTFARLQDLTERLLMLFQTSLPGSDMELYDLLPVSFEREIPEVSHEDIPVHAQESNGQNVGPFEEKIQSAYKHHKNRWTTANEGPCKENVQLAAKVNKNRRRRAAKRQKSQGIAEETQMSNKRKEKTRKEQERYAKDPLFRNKKQSNIRRRYREDAAYSDRMKSRVRTQYRQDAAYSDRMKSRVRAQYRQDAVYSARMKSRVRTRYREDAAYSARMKSRVRTQYKDTAYSAEMKCCLRKLYREDAAYSARKKAYVKMRYQKDAALREKKKSLLKHRYAVDGAYRTSRKLYEHERYSSDCDFQQRKKRAHKIRCSKNIQRKYRNLRPPRETQHNSRGLPDPLMEKVISSFKSQIAAGPTYICTVCHRCLFPDQVRTCILSNYSKNVELASMCITGTYVHVCEDSCTGRVDCCLPERKKEWICHCCHENLKSGRLPSIAVVNNLQLSPIPPELQGLNILERHVIAKYIPFAKIIALPKGQQRAIHGPVICVPSEVESTVHCLPRPKSESQLLKVKLKRRLRYKGYFQFQTLDMNKVFAALLKLKEIHSEYKDISLRDDAYCETLEDIPANAVDDSDDDDSEEPGQANNPEPEQPQDREKDCEEQRSSIPLDTCLQPQDVGQELLSYGENIFSIAPAEGNQPVSFFKVQNLESMAFPVQFSTGKNTLDAPDRPRKISPSRYFNARLLSVDNRFAFDTNYIFFAQFVTEMHMAMSSMSVQLRKGKPFTKTGQRITTALLKDKREVEKLVKRKEVTRFMQPLRGTPAYWQKTMNDLFAMLRQLGTPTFFCTFSAAEMRWPEIITTIKAQQGESVDFAELDWNTKCDIIRSNPVTVIRLFEKRVEALMTHLITSPAHPIGEVLDFFYRVEFQARGSGHIHCLFWVKDAPDFECDPAQKVVEFIDRYISCQLPDEQKDPELHRIVKEVQTHSRNHSKSCKKGNRHCRFGFPKPPMKSTFITEPMIAKADKSEQASSAEQKHAKTKLQAVWNVLNDPKASFESIDELLAHCNLTYEEYGNCLEFLSDNNVIIMKRDLKDCWVNGYNPHLLRAWNANMDIQYILNPYSCIMYMLSYIAKAEHEMSNYLQRIVGDATSENMSELDEMKKVMQAYSKNREVSAQEAVTRVCSLKLKNCSRSVVFIPTDDNALKMSLPMRCLEDRDPNSDNVWMTGLPEKYEARPPTPEFEAMCMAEFASKYRFVYGRQRQGKDVLQLQGDMGFIQKRKGKDAVIRYAKFSEKKTPEKFYGTLLKLYLPHRNKVQLKSQRFNTYETFYANAYVKLPGTEELTSVYEVVQNNMKNFEKNNETIEQAIDSFIQSGPIVDEWSNLAPNTEMVRLESIAECEHIDPEELGEMDNVPEYSVNKERQPTIAVMECPKLSSADLKKMYQSLNQEQAAVFYTIRDWCLRLVNGQNPEQFFYFVTGGAGTGKSHLIKCVYNEASRIMRKLPVLTEECDISLPTVLLTAFTGTAAFNISGQTLHSILKLPRSLKPPYQGLGNCLDEVRAKLSNVQIIIIDEISMVSKSLFAYVHWRLEQIKGSKKPFGGVSVLAVGDFYQLPPLGSAKPLCIYEDTVLDVWKDKFQMASLTEIMRQREDVPFAEMLNRLRVKRRKERLHDDDKALLDSRTFTDKADCPSDVLHIFATNKQVDEHNETTVRALHSHLTLIPAEDYKKDERTGRMVRQSAPFKGGKRDLPDTLQLSEGVRVVLTRNLDIEDGLVNGTFAKVAEIVTRTDVDGQPYVHAIGLVCDNPTAGTKRCKPAAGRPEQLVFIEREEEKMKKKGTVRRQFPMRLAFACTTHKVQGMTSQSAVVSLKRIFEPGMSYVALSRTTSLQGLYIMDFKEDKIFCNEEITASLESMPKLETENVMPFLKFTNGPLPQSTQILKVVHHNVEGLSCHMDDIRKHHQLLLGDILCFTETHLFGEFIPENLSLEDYTMYRRNRQASYSSYPHLAREKGGGVAIYARKNLRTRQMVHIQNVTDMEFVVLKVETPIQLIVAAVYRPPNYHVAQFLPNMRNLLDALEITDCRFRVICGDFNENLLGNSPKPIFDMMSGRGYRQLIRDKTTEKNTLIDPIFLSQPGECLESGVLHTYFSYHSPVYAILPTK